MPLVRTTRPAVIAAAGLLLLGASACSSDDEPVAAEETEESTETTETTETPTSETTEAPDEAAADDETAAEGDVPEWAFPYERRGELLTTLEGEGFRVEVYQVGTTTATKGGQFVDPDTNEPLLKAGDEIVFVNYVITNTGDEAVNLPYTLVNVDAVYDDWPYLQGMDSVVDGALFEEMGVLDGALKPGGDADYFVWEPGTSFAYGENFKYQPGSGMTFSATLTPADESGEMLHDERQDVEATATIA